VGKEGKQLKTLKKKIWKDVSDHLSLFLIAVVFELVAMLANQLVKCQEVVYSAGMDVIFECCC